MITMSESLPSVVNPGIACLDSTSSIMSHTNIDQACLEIVNLEPDLTIELWGQSQECYKCSFWPYASIPPQGNASLVVNTTYGTLLSTQVQEAHLYGLQYHFQQYGLYRLKLNKTNFSIEEIREPHSPFLPLLYAAIFYLMLLLMWQFANFLKRSMDNGSSPEEASPILRAPHNYGTSASSTNAAGTSGAPQHTTGPPVSDGGNIITSSYPSGFLSSSGLNAGVTQNATQDGSTAAGGTSLDSRLRSLDVFRGITIFLMIFVNYGGGQYYFFLHSPWNGLTVADLLFPWFMWIMGVSLVFSQQSQFRKGLPLSTVVLKIIKRSIILFCLGLMVNGMSNRNVPTLRIPGVLQRFSICYLFVALLEALLTTHPTVPQTDDELGGWFMFRDIVRSWLQWSIVIGLVSVHTLVTYVLPVPGCPRGYIGPGGLHDYGAHSNCTGGAASYVDRMIFGASHIYRGSTARHVYQNTVPHDPEGILGTLTALLMVELGVSAGRILVTFSTHQQRLVRLLAWAGACGITAGILCNFDKETGVIPVNKNLWSVSYVLVTACFALLFFAAVYALVDWARAWNGNPARYFGLNSILLYVGHELVRNVFPFSWTPAGPTHGEHLLMNLWGASLWGVIAYVCHKKKLYLSV